MKDYLKIKSSIFERCKDFVDAKESTVLDIISSNKKDLLSETKSSAGDKHETGRAMIQLEMEKASQQLSVISEMKETLKRISIEEPSKNVKLGSLAITNKGTYFLAISVGQVNIENNSYFVVSSKSPIGIQLLGKQVGDTISFNKAEILEIY